MAIISSGLMALAFALTVYAAGSIVAGKIGEWRRGDQDQEAPPQR